MPFSSVTCLPLIPENTRRDGEQHPAQHTCATRYDSALIKQERITYTHTRTARIDQLRNSLFNRFEKLLEQAQVSEGMSTRKERKAFDEAGLLALRWKANECVKTTAREE
jgi:hypothetical protein